METSKTWLEQLEALNNPFILECVVNEATRLRFVGKLPDELAFLQHSFVDLGFEDYGSHELLSSMGKAIIGDGVLIPGTHYRMRTKNSGHTLIEPATGTETLALPKDWKQYVCVFGNGVQRTWIGKKVSQDRLGEVDMSLYTDAGDGWALVA